MEPKQFPSDEDNAGKDRAIDSGQNKGLDPVVCHELIEAAEHGICVTHPNGVVAYLNPACCRMLEVTSPACAIGNHIWDMFPCEVVRAVQDRILPQAAKGTYWSGDIPLMNASRHSIPMFASVTPIPDGDGSVRFIVWLFTDISAVHATMTELGKSKDFLLNIINSIGDPIIVKDRDSRIVLVNESAARLTGVHKKDLIGKMESDFHPQVLAQKWVESDRQVFESGEDKLSEHTIEIQGAERIFSAKKSRLNDPDTGQQFVIAALRDVTGIKDIERELVTYREHLEELVAQRTSELQEANRALETEIAERRNAEESLRRSELSVAEKARHLEETNIALKVLLDHQDDEKLKLGETIAASVNNLITPYLEKLRQISTDPAMATLTEIISTNIAEIVKPFAKDLSAPPAGLSATEIQVAKMTAEGKTAKEIADIMVISENTIKVHKRNIRKKLGIRSSGANLRSFLQRIFEKGIAG